MNMVITEKFRERSGVLFTDLVFLCRKKELCYFEELQFEVAAISTGRNIMLANRKMRFKCAGK